MSLWEQTLCRFSIIISMLQRRMEHFKCKECMLEQSHILSMFKADMSVQCRSHESIGLPAAADLHTQVSQLADSFAISDADCLDAPFRPVLQDLVHHSCSINVPSHIQARFALCHRGTGA